MDVQQRSRAIKFPIYENNTERHVDDGDGNMPDKSYQSLVRIKSQNGDNTYDVIHTEEPTSKSTEKNKLKNGNITTWKILALFFGISTVISGGGVAYLCAKILSRESCSSPGKNQTGLDQDLIACKCNQGYSGRCCEITPCDRIICENGKSCLYDGNMTLCANILKQSQGLNNCKSACASLPCRNNGQCVEVVGGYTCICSSGYTGITCKTLIHPCRRSPCKNNGNCTENGYDYKCDCPKGFSASDCHETPCDNFPCKNQGRCENIASGRNCNCKEGYTGTDCEKTPCSGSPCKNGGFCSNRGSIYHCTCPLGTSGINCQNISCGFPEYRRNVLNQKTCNISPCLKDWIFNIATFSCYWIDIRKARWSSANKICQSKGASLAFIQSLEEIKWLEQFINENVWVGGRAANKQYQWQSSEYNYAIHNQSNLWTQNEPGSFNRNYCVQLWKRTESFLLDDTTCSQENRFICKTTNLQRT
ncbi:neurogenic locus Notch protein-like [Mytilus trossulus]|uniref:neurogenic locus Notch protein-like n=1 Tax=Mytilus trossulus TaxID=6551 RepID=UPI0030062028